MWTESHAHIGYLNHQKPDSMKQLRRRSGCAATACRKKEGPETPLNALLPPLCVCFRSKAPIFQTMPQIPCETHLLRHFLYNSASFLFIFDLWHIVIWCHWGSTWGGAGQRDQLMHWFSEWNFLWNRYAAKILQCARRQLRIDQTKSAYSPVLLQDNHSVQTGKSNISGAVCGAFRATYWDKHFDILRSGDITHVMAPHFKNLPTIQSRPIPGSISERHLGL